MCEAPAINLAGRRAGLLGKGDKCMRPNTHPIMDSVCPGSGLHGGPGTIFHTLDQVLATPRCVLFLPPITPSFHPSRLALGESLPPPGPPSLTPDKIFIQSINGEHLPLNVLLTWKCSSANGAGEPRQTRNPLPSPPSEWAAKGRGRAGGLVARGRCCPRPVVCGTRGGCVCHGLGRGCSIPSKGSRTLLATAWNRTPELAWELPDLQRVPTAPRARSQASTYLTPESPLLLVHWTALFFPPAWV